MNNATSERPPVNPTKEQLREWFKKNCKTSDPENPRTMPLPHMELFRYGKHEVSRDRIEPPRTRSRVYCAVPVQSVSPMTPPYSPGERRSERIGKRSARGSSSSSDSKPRKQYTLKSDAERNNERYKSLRKVNNLAVKESRQKKKLREEEEKAANILEKALLRSTIKKLIERYEPHTLSYPNGVVPVGFGQLTAEEEALYNQIREEARNELLYR